MWVGTAMGEQPIERVARIEWITLAVAAGFPALVGVLALLLRELAA